MPLLLTLLLLLSLLLFPLLVGHLAETQSKGFKCRNAAGTLQERRCLDVSALDRLNSRMNRDFGDITECLLPPPWISARCCPLVAVFARRSPLCRLIQSHAGLGRAGPAKSQQAIQHLLLLHSAGAGSPHHLRKNERDERP